MNVWKVGGHSPEFRSNVSLAKFMVMEAKGRRENMTRVML